MNAFDWEALVLIGAAMGANLAWVKFKARQAKANDNNDKGN